MMQKVIFQDLRRIDYKKAWDYQQALLKEVVDIKLSNRRRSDDTPAISPKHYLLFCEHPSVFTLGKSGSIEHLLLNESGLAEKDIDFYSINRGGDITFHGLGQLVGYPIFDLECFFTDVHKYVRYLEEIIIRTLADYGLEGIRISDYTGVWLAAKKEQPQRKICAIGVHLSRWVTMHGFALNVNTDLNYFSYIIPCGINDSNKTVTSLSKELGQKIDEEDVKRRVKYHFSDLFGFEYKK